VLDLGDELDDVAARPAPVAVVEAVVRVDVERPGLLVVEGAQPDQRRPAAGEGDVLADDLFDRGPLLDGKDVLRPDLPRHRHTSSLLPASVCRVLASPPGLSTGRRSRFVVRASGRSVKSNVSSKVDRSR
jgi:hypothetical protein